MKNSYAFEFKTKPSYTMKGNYIAIIDQPESYRGTEDNGEFQSDCFTFKSVSMPEMQYYSENNAENTFFCKRRFEYKRH